MTTQKDIRKAQIKTMAVVLADSVVGQLIKAGAERGELRGFASEVIRSISHKAFADQDILDRNGDCDESGPERNTLSMSVRKSPEGKCCLSDGRVLLRPLTEADHDLLSKWAQEGEIEHTLSHRLLMQLVAQMDNRTIVPWSNQQIFIVCNENKEPVGLICLLKIRPEIGQAETAKLLGDPAARGKGYASAASRLLLAYAFNELSLGRIYLQTAGFNLHNIVLNEKVGFMFEGVLRNSDKIGDKLVDVVIMSILRREFFQRYRIERSE